MSSPRSNLILFLIISGAAIFSDQLTKYLITLSDRQPIVLGHPVFQLVYQENRLAAFSLPIGGVLLSIIVAILILGFSLFIWRSLNWQQPLTAIVSALILGGAISNLVDRVFLGYVIDFIKIWLYPIFNLADIFISLGIFILLIFYSRLSLHS